MTHKERRFGCSKLVTTHYIASYFRTNQEEGNEDEKKATIQQRSGKYNERKDETGV